MLLAIDVLFWLLDPRAWRARLMQIGVGVGGLAVLAARTNNAAPQARARRAASHLRRTEQVRERRARAAVERAAITEQVRAPTRG